MKPKNFLDSFCRRDGKENSNFLMRDEFIGMKFVLVFFSVRTNQRINKTIDTALTRDRDSEAGGEGDAGVRQPRAAGNEIPDGEFRSLRRAGNHMVTLPFHSISRRRSRSGIRILAVIERI